MADSPPSTPMCCRYHPLGKGGDSALTTPPTKTEARPFSWSPSLLAPSAHVGVLILLCTKEALEGSPAACRTAEPRDLLVSSDAPERGWTRRQPTALPGSCCALHVSCGDGAAHLQPWLRVLLVFQWKQGCWLHFGIIRGTPCSTIATVALRHSSGGSGGQGCRGYGQTSWPQWTQQPAITLRVLEITPVSELLHAGE